VPMVTLRQKRWLSLYVTVSTGFPLCVQFYLSNIICFR
jgi:hypothetical protein